MKSLSTAAIIGVLMFSSPLWARGVAKASLNFAASKVNKLHCNIKQTSFGPWDLTVVVEDSSGHAVFDYLYSVHPTFKDSMRDCNAWMKAVSEKMKKAHVPEQSGSQLAQQ